MAAILFTGMGYVNLGVQEIPAIMCVYRRKSFYNAGVYGPVVALGRSGSSDDAGEAYALNEDETAKESVRQARKANNTKTATYWRVESRGLIAGALNLSRYSNAF